MKIISESEMSFGKFDKADLFHIEDSNLYQTLGSGVKTVEFILRYKEDSIVFLEAKKSCPNSANRKKSEEKAEKFEEYYASITEKFAASLQIYLAAILGIDQEMYEAAEIDGATRWNKIRFITLPMLKSTVITLTLMNVGRIFYSDFGLFYQVPMNSGALINATNTIDTYVYRGLIELGDISMSSAACVYQSLVGFVLVLTANWVTKKLSSENALF